MPQMSPMNWIFLFLMFTLLYFSMNILLYYFFLLKINKTSKIKNLSKMNWKW